MNINGTNILCLAIETKNKIQIEKILNFLMKKLPRYSIPKRILFFKQFPLNHNNKIDKKN